ncbi:MAG TPA: Vms1/Ankzf1 family peptidyl-tRNA hydrolase [Gemmatimonadota bacterium]|jgi:peptide chain release factor subunit 1
MAHSTALPTRETLEALRALGDRPLWSVYLDLSVGSNGQRTHEVFLRKKEVQFGELLAGDDAPREALGRVLRRIREWLAGEFDESHGGAALFFSDDGELLHAVQLTGAVEPLFVRGPGAVVAPLARVVEDHDHHCVVVLDSSRARILSVYLDAVEDEVSYADPTVPARTRGGGWSQARFQRHRAEHVQRFHAEVAEHLERFLRRHRCDDLILLGTDEATSDFAKALPPAVAARVRFAKPAPADEPAAALLERIRGVLEEDHVREDDEVLERLERRVREDYLAVAGVRATLHDLQAGKVETLVLGSGLPRGGGQCRRCEFLLADGEVVCPYCGGEVAPVDLYEKMVDLARRTDARIEFVEGDAEARLLDAMNGAGAFLKFT